MSNHQDAEMLWQYIVSELSVFPQDIQTILQDASNGIWVHARVNDGNVEIYKAKDNKPSSSLRSPCYITKSEFIAMHPIYYQWREGKITRADVTQESRKSSYIFALIHKFDDTHSNR